VGRLVAIWGFAEERPRHPDERGPRHLVGRKPVHRGSIEWLTFGGSRT